MANARELIKSAEAKIIQLKQTLKKFDEAAMKTRAEIKAFENMIEWTKATKEKVEVKKK